MSHGAARHEIERDDMGGRMHSERRTLNAAIVIAVIALGSLTFGVHAQNRGTIQEQHAQYRDPLLGGTVDLHIHSGPDSRPRALNHLEVARLARQAGMRGFLLKQHLIESSHLAALVMEEVPGIEVFGAVILNHSNGGINPDAIRSMLAVEGKRGRMVMLPTWDAENDTARKRENRPAVPVLKDGKPVPRLAEVFKLIADNDLLLATGHLSPDESLAMIAAAKQAGARRFIVTHPRELGMTRDQMQRAVGLGAFFECTYGDLTPDERGIHEDCSTMVKAIGAQHFVWGSDLGQRGRILPTDGLKTFIMKLRQDGIPQDQIDFLVRKNPARLIGLDPW
jgi:hypothetical protein